MSIKEILRRYKNVAVVGLSPNPERPSFRVASYLTEHGYHIIPVNPTVPRIMDRKSYPDLASIPDKVEVVDIFRKSEDVLPIVEEAIRIGAKAVWMQEGVINEPAARLARKAGLLVIMDRCMRKEHMHLQS